MAKRILAILPISIGGRLTMSSIIDGYCQNGCEVAVYDELSPQAFQASFEEEYDQILGYDYSAIILKKKHNLNAPAVNYFSDEIRTKMSGVYWQEYVEELEKDDNYTFYWDKALTEKEQKQIKNIFYLPHFVNLEVYKDFQTQPQFDVMFAGRLDTDFRLNFFEELVAKLPDLKFVWYAFEKHYEDAKNRSNNPKLLEKCYKGFIDNEADMSRAINNTKIVFNMNSQGVSSLNYRTFQTIACKRLLISDYREELSLFDGNLPYYKDLCDLAEKINLYLNDKILYDETCEKCYEIVKLSHDARKSVQKMINVC